MFESIDVTYVKGNVYELVGTYKGKKHVSTVELDPKVPIADAIELAIEQFERHVFSRIG